MVIKQCKQRSNAIVKWHGTHNILNTRFEYQWGEINRVIDWVKAYTLVCPK